MVVISLRNGDVNIFPSGEENESNKVQQIGELLQELEG